MNDMFLNDSFYKRNKIKIYSIMLISLLISSIIVYFYRDFNRLNDYKNNWTNIYTKNIKILSEINNYQDIEGAITKSDYLIKESLDLIEDTNDKYEEGAINLYNNLLKENIYLKDILSNNNSKDNSFLKTIDTLIGEDKLIIQNLKIANKNTLSNL